MLNLSVRNADGEMVPFSSFMTVRQVMGEPTVSRYNMYRTASLTATTPHDVSSSEGIKAMEEIVDKTLGKEYSYAWTGEAYQETQGRHDYRHGAHILRHHHSACACGAV